jgi:hypothetical protein
MQKYVKKTWGFNSTETYAVNEEISAVIWKGVAVTKLKARFFFP